MTNSELIQKLKDRIAEIENKMSFEYKTWNAWQQGYWTGRQRALENMLKELDEKTSDYALNSENLIVNAQGNIINEPSIMFDRVTGELFAHGEKTYVDENYKKFQETHSSSDAEDVIRIYWNMKQMCPTRLTNELNELIKSDKNLKIFFQNLHDYPRRFYTKIEGSGELFTNP